MRSSRERSRAATADGAARLPAAADDQPLEVRGGAGGGAQGALVGDGLVGQALGAVRDRRHGGDPQAAMAGGDDLGDGRHADRVGAERPEGADLGRRLEARAADLAR